MINERLKLLRTSLNLTQTAFAKSIGVAQSTLGMMEINKRELFERHIKTICSIYNVNEDWLRNGNGEMFKKKTEINILEVIKERYNLSISEINIINNFLEMESAERKIFSDILYKVTKKEEFYNNECEKFRSQKNTNPIILTNDTVDN